ncbi:transposase, MuDR, MULE transposase domain protein [Artemisia annua]|uniref:Transposase, MuDR, MULE transposase domain protein n=1 Tax=Artemisia annua TaxID=35608 RepID=A0A2U1QHW1_ARTAN|nr:transposase, MuDR, MULE transposase domain protein [Artemisia annua]
MVVPMSLVLFTFIGMLDELGLGDDKILFTHFRIPEESLDDRLFPLISEEHVVILLKYVPRFKEIEVYIETYVSLVEQHLMEMRSRRGKGVVIEDIEEGDLVKEAEKDGKLCLLE